MTRVLIVDDREENLYLLRALLEGHGYEVAVAHQGVEALRIARDSPPDLVISDLLMPVMDGYTLLRQWRADERLKGLPFLVYTATYTEEEDERLAMRLGADVFIVKPADPEVLLRYIQDSQALESVATPTPGEGADGDPEDPLEAYNQVLVRKLEKKMGELESANRRLQEDLAARTRDKEALERSAALLRIAGHAAQLGGWVLDLEKRVLAWSDEVCALHDAPAGCTPSLGEAIAYHLPDYGERLTVAFERCAEQGTPIDLESQLETASGRRVWVRIVGEPVTDGNGRILRLQGAIQDVSDRKRLERAVLRAQRMESIGTLAGGMAHDLNNILSPILISSQLLRDEVEDEELRDILATIEGSAQRGADMVKQVLSFARGVEGTQVRVDLHRILRDLGSLVRDTFVPTVTYDTQLADDLWDLTGDPTQIHQVLMNLILNARDAMPKGGRISVVARNVDVDAHYAAMGGQAFPGRYVQITVADSGVGIPRDVLPHIFDPLFTTKPVGKGTGLGLSTVAAIMRGHRGFVNVYSEVDVGTTFRLHFPTGVGAGIASLPEDASPDWQGNGELILVVDDEASVRSITQQTLEVFGYRVVTAGHGVEAIGVFERLGSDVALLLTDLVMPVMDGPATIQALRATDPKLKVLAVSGIGADGGEERAAAAGAKHFLPKPYTADALLAAIHQALREEVTEEAREG